MKLSKAATIWIDYHKTHSKKTFGRSFPAPPFTATTSTAASSCSIPSTFTTTSS
ncbi:MAG: hypothetical protein WCB15_32950 [Desulfobacterales bacterium]